MKLSSPFYEQGLTTLSISPLFADLEKTLISEMMEVFTWQTWKRDAIVSPEHNQKWFHVIVDGRLEFCRTNLQTGREMVVALYKKGDIFDVITLLHYNKHDVLTTPIDDMATLMAPIETVRDWLHKYPNFNDNFLPYVGEKMQALEKLSSDLVLHDTTTRLAQLILDNIDEASKTSNEHVSLINNLSHERIARIIGSVRVVVNRSIQKLKNEGLITNKRNQLIIRDFEGLKAKYGHHLN